MGLFAARTECFVKAKHIASKNKFASRRATLSLKSPSFKPMLNWTELDRAGPTSDLLQNDSGMSCGPRKSTLMIICSLPNVQRLLEERNQLELKQSGKQPWPQNTPCMRGVASNCIHIPPCLSLSLSLSLSLFLSLCRSISPSLSCSVGYIDRFISVSAFLSVDL